MKFAAILDMIVDNYAFLAGDSLEASAQQQGNVCGHGQALFLRPTCGGISDIPFDLDSSQVAH